MNTLLSLSALGAALLVPPTSASAFTHPDRSAAIDYSDLNLRSKADISRLDARIRAAVQEVCGAASDTDLKGKNDVRACKDQMTSAAARARDSAITRAEARSFAQK